MMWQVLLAVVAGIPLVVLLWGVAFLILRDIWNGEL